MPDKNHPSRFHMWSLVSAVACGVGAGSSFLGGDVLMGIVFVVGAIAMLCIDKVEWNELFDPKELAQLSSSGRDPRDVKTFVRYAAFVSVFGAVLVVASLLKGNFSDAIGCALIAAGFVAVLGWITYKDN